MSEEALLIMANLLLCLLDRSLMPVHMYDMHVICGRWQVQRGMHTIWHQRLQRVHSCCQKTLIRPILHFHACHTCLS